MLPGPAIVKGKSLNVLSSQEAGLPAALREAAASYSTTIGTART